MAQGRFDGSIPDRHDEVSFRPRSNAEEAHTARIAYVDPVVNPDSRTVRVRAEMANHRGRLKPNTLVRGTVRSNGQMGERLVVPTSAVLWTRPRSIVYLKDPDAEVPTFETREVGLGPRVGDHHVIEDGLEAGEEVVIHGTFKVDSEFQISERYSMMNRGADR